jgi:Domain of unknown function (DUF4112)
MASGGFGTSEDILRWLARAGRELGRDEEAALRRVARLAYWLDDRFRIPGTSRRVGLDGLLGLIPGIGDTATTLVAAYIVIEAARMGVPKRTIARMLGNVGVDYVIGLVPLAGDLADLAWKANRRNARLLHDHLTAERSGAPAPQGARTQSMAAPGVPAGQGSAEGRGGDDGQRAHRRRADPPPGA